MSPGEASANGVVLEILHPVGGKRVCAQVFDVRGGGTAFLDSGWTNPLCTNHVVHMISGSFGRTGISWRTTLPEGDCFFRERTGLRPEGDRDLARKVLEEEFAIELL